MRKLRPYQKDILKYARKVQHPVLFVDMRLGKTLVAIRACKLKNFNSILIVCPYSAFRAWKKELYKEGEGAPIELTGTRKQRLNKLFNNWPLSQWYIINKEGFLSAYEINKLPWDVVILDESTFIKTPKSQVSRFFVNNFRNVKQRWILTGTPAPEGELDYFQQLKFINPEILPFKNFWIFRHKYFELKEYKWELTEKGKRYLSQRLAKYCYFLTRKQAGIGNIKIYEQRNIKMPAKIKEVYATLKREFILDIGDEFKFTKYATTKWIWLRRLMGGYFNGKFYWDGKCRALEELYFSELKHEPLIIWCSFREDIQMLKTYFGNRIKIGIIHGDVKLEDRDKIVDAFNAEQIQWIISMAECFKYSQDLSKASTVLFYSSPESLETRLQTEDRPVDVSLNEPILILDLIVEDSIEETIYDSLARKEGKQTMMRRVVNKLRKEMK